jgi:hypothetical protein
MRLERRFSSVIGVAVTLLLIAIDIAISYELGSSFGRNDFEGLLYGGACALAAILKAILPIRVRALFKEWRPVAAAAASLLWLLCATLSFTGAVGFGITARNSAKDAQTLQAELNRSKLRSLNTDQTELDRVQNRLRSTSLTLRERREYEQRVYQLEARIANRQSEVKHAPSILTATSQADALARLLSVAPEWMISVGPEWTNVILVTVLALMLELGTSFGLLVSMSTSDKATASPPETCPPRPPGKSGRRPVSPIAERAPATNEHTVSLELANDVMRSAVSEFLHDPKDRRFGRGGHRIVRSLQGVLPQTWSANLHPAKVRR